MGCNQSQTSKVNAFLIDKMHKCIEMLKFHIYEIMEVKDRTPYNATLRQLGPSFIMEQTLPLVNEANMLIKIANMRIKEERDWSLISKLELLQINLERILMIRQTLHNFV
jgi:hypothetical protein